MRRTRATALLFAGLLLTLTAPASAGQSTPRQVLFICPHGAAKSVLASAYFEQAAKAKGLNVRVDAAGTDPDPTVSPKVAAHLKQQGYRVPITTPRRVAQQDLDTADVVVSLGCDLKGLTVPAKTLQRWDEVPGPGEDFAGADAAIRRRVDQLVDELVKQVK
jgi:arsenate reductase